MTEINQRAIVHTLPLMRQPIDTGINSGAGRERGMPRGNERRGGKVQTKNGKRTIGKRKLEEKFALFCQEENIIISYSKNTST